MNEPTEFGSINDALKRRYGVIGEGPVSTLASDGFPVIQVSDESLDPEMHFLSGSKLCAGGTPFTPVVAEIGSIGLRNPADSGIIAVIQSIQATAAAVATFIVEREWGLSQTPDTLSAFVSSPVDSRWRAQNGGLIGFTDSSVAGMAGIQIYRISGSPAFTPFIIPCTPIILTPGSQFWVQTNSVTIEVAASFRWRERRITKWEDAQP